MASSISNFNANNQQLSFRFLADLTKSGSYTNYANNLLYFNILQSTSKLYGIFDSQLDAELQFDYNDLISTAPNWAKRGRDIQAYISTTGDSWATNYEHKVFSGSTNRQQSVPFDKVKINATCYNSDYLERSLGAFATTTTWTYNSNTYNIGYRRVWVNTDINTIISDLLLAVGVSGGDISLTSSGVTLGVYTANDSQPIKEFIEDLAIASGQIVGFDRDGIFRAFSLTRLTLSASTITPDLTVDLSTQLDFDLVPVEDTFYANDITVKGNYLSIVDQTNTTPLYFNGEITGFSIPAGKSSVYVVEDNTLIPIIINELKKPTAITTEYYQPDYLTNPQPTKIGNFVFLNTDDKTSGSIQSDVNLIGYGITDDPTTGQSQIILNFYNSSNNTRYLKELLIFGIGIRIGDDIHVNRELASLIASSGQKKSLELSSLGIQTATTANNLVDILKLNVANETSSYRFSIVGYPSLRIGSVVSFKDRTNTNTFAGIVTKIDEEFNPQNTNKPIYDQKITVKLIDTSSTYFTLDSSLLDGSNLLF